jgi:hypothetical protein
MPKIPISSRVFHTGHGIGTVIAYNQTKPNNPKLLTHIQELEKSDAAILAPILHGAVNSFYDGKTFPYVVRFDHQGNRPDAGPYTDVYSDHDLEVLNVTAEE